MTFLLRVIIGFGRRHSGATAVEFALTAPVLFALLFGMFEFGQMLWARNSLQYAVEEAARCAAVSNAPCTSDTAIKSFAVSQVYGIEINSSAFSVTHTTVSPCSIKVSVSFPFTFLLPFEFYSPHINSSNWAPTLTGQSTRPIPCA